MNESVMSNGGVCREEIMTEITDMAVDILRTTRDGNELHNSDLALLQMAVNGNLNDAGLEEFDVLYHLVQTGEYNIGERWKKVFKKTADLAKYRVSMKRKLRVIGCQFDGSETTEQLEEMIRINNLEVQGDG